MGCSSCQKNNHVVPTTSGTHHATSHTHETVYCDCACGCNEPVCPTPQPCTEITDSKCIIYTDAAIKCGEDTVVTTNSSVSTALNQIVDYLCSESPTPPEPPVGALFQIPELNMYLKNDKIHASLLPGLYSDEYKNHNPRVFLFVKRNGRNRKVTDINGDPQKKYYHGGWRHITHMQGVNFPSGNFYSGSTLCPTHSEWPLTISNPYEKQELTTLDVGEFYKYNNILPNLPAPFGTVPWTVSNVNKFSVRGVRGERPTKSVYFRFAIGINNPDATSDYPIIFGALSIPIQCKIVKKGGAVDYSLHLQPNGIKHFNH
jgi:hypothetical protein